MNIIADGAFYRCSKYYSIVVEGNLESIGVSVFANARIREFLVKGTIGTLGAGSFCYSFVYEWNCDGGVKEYGKDVFLGADIPDNIRADMVIKTYLGLLKNRMLSCIRWIFPLWTFL